MPGRRLAVVGLSGCPYPAPGPAIAAGVVRRVGGQNHRSRCLDGDDAIFRGQNQMVMVMTIPLDIGSYIALKKPDPFVSLEKRK